MKRAGTALGGLYVQYGCGWSAPQGWLNFDSSPTLRFERLPLIGRLYTRNAQRFPDNVRYGDIVNGLPLEPASCRGLYCSHVLEHLALEDVDRALCNSHRLLGEGGIFRLVLPDLRSMARAYLDDPDAQASIRFMRATYLGRESRGGLAYAIRDWLGGSAHRWMWDSAALVQKLVEHGFSRVREAKFGDCADPRFAEVEDRTRFEGAFALECVR